MKATTTMEMRADRYKPFPEILSGATGTYRILDSRFTPGLPTNGMTDKRNRVLWVPFDRPGREVARHELAHVIWSPDFLELPRLRAPVMVVQAVEDARINRGLYHAGIPIAFDPEMCRQGLQLARKDLAAGEYAAFVLRSVAASGTSAWPAILDPLDEADETHQSLGALVHETVRRLERARSKTGDLVPTFGQGVTVARWLARQLKSGGHAIPEPGTALLGCCGGVGTDGHDVAGIGLGPLSGHGVASGPGRLTIRRVPLPHRVATTVRTPRPRARAAAEGTDLRYIDRFVVDQRCFRIAPRTNARAAGTILIDASGSMNLSLEDLDRIVDRAPAALVAVYSGHETTGQLRVIVENGHRADPSRCKTPGNGNIVDIPALEWLAKQPEPRIWISDGGVTGCMDVPSAALKRHSKHLCQTGRITRVPDADGALRILTKGDRRTGT